METAYLSHELSAGSKKTLTNPRKSLTPVETVDNLDNNVRPPGEQNPINNGPQIKTESDCAVEQLANNPKTEKPKKKSTTVAKPKFPYDTNDPIFVVQKTKEILARLLSCGDYTSDKCTGDLGVLSSISYLPKEHCDLQKMCFDVMAEHNVTSVLKRVMEQNLKLPFDKPEFKTSFVNMKSIIVVHWNGTDASQKLCDSVMGSDVYADILTYLTSDVLKPEEFESLNKIYVVKGLLGILHNLCQKCTNARALLREKNAVAIVQEYKNSKNNMVRCKALMALAHIIDEKENDMINSDDKPIEFMLSILKDTLMYDEHYSKKYGYRTAEILEVLNRLAGSDSNKLKMVKHGCLELYAKLLEQSASVEEQKLSAQGLWALAFKAPESILSDKNCMQGLQALVQNSKEKDVVSQAKGALWILKGHDNEENKKKKNMIARAKTGSSDGQHIMISYQWGNKSTMLKIRDQLKENGYKVWMDEDDMEGNILDGMAEAIENAAVVLVCMSQKYKDSPNCRTEAEYAYKLRKKIVPLKLQFRYDPDGWLGIIVGTKLYFDFSEETRYERSLKGILKELAAKEQTDMVMQLRPVKPNSVSDTHNAPRPNVAAKNEVEQWDQQKVMSWLDKNKLAKYKDKFAEFDGLLLVEYLEMMENAPDFFYATLTDVMKLPLVDMLRLSSSLRKLKS